MPYENPETVGLADLLNRFYPKKERIAVINGRYQIVNRDAVRQDGGAAADSLDLMPEPDESDVF